MTYAALAALFVAATAVIAVLVSWRCRLGPAWWATTALTILGLLLLTVVFDSLMIAVDLFRYDEAQHALVGSRSRKVHRLGDTVEVRLVEAAPVAGALRFELLSAGGTARKGLKAARDGKAKFTAKFTRERRRG